MLELINRARLDPQAEAARFGISLNNGLAEGTISSAPKAPLAFNSDLNESAAGHSSWMLAADVFSHTGSGGSNSATRMKNAGYVFTGSWAAARTSPGAARRARSTSHSRSTSSTRACS